MAKKVALCERLHIARQETRQIEQHSRQLRIDPFVRTHFLVAKIEKGLPVNKTLRGAFPAAEVIGVVTIRKAIVENQFKDLRINVRRTAPKFERYDGRT